MKSLALGHAFGTRCSPRHALGVAAGLALAIGTPRLGSAQAAHRDRGSFSAELRGPCAGPLAGPATFSFGSSDVLSIELSDTTQRGFITLSFWRRGQEAPGAGTYPLVAPNGDWPPDGTFGASLRLPPIAPTGCGIHFRPDTAEGRLVIDSANTVAAIGRFEVKLFHRSGASPYPRPAAGLDTAWVVGRFRAPNNDAYGTARAAWQRMQAVLVRTDTAYEAPAPPSHYFRAPPPDAWGRTMVGTPALPPPAPGRATALMRGNGRPELVIDELPRPVPMAGSARWSTDIDPFDFRSRATIHLTLDGVGQHAVITVRAAAGTALHPGAPDVVVLPTGTSHANPKFLAGEMIANDAGRPKRYGLGGGRDSVWIDSISRRGVVYGHLHAMPSRYGPRDPETPLLFQWVTREVMASFAATPAPPAPAPAMTDSAQERVLRRALDGFAITWSGAINGDGPRDSVMTSAAARRFLRARWGSVLRVDSLSVGTEGFYLQVSGAIRPVTCVLTGDDVLAECTRSAPPMKR